MPARFTDKVVLVSGATGGIGAHTVRRLADEGARVVITDVADGPCMELAATLNGDHLAIALDVQDEEQWRAAVARAVSEFGGLHVLVNNAGIGVTKPFVDLSPDEWHRMIDVNDNALFHVTRAVLPGMFARGSGHVCTVGSIGARSVFAGGSCYGATKAFVTAWAENLMIEVREQGVKVSVVMPGAVATAFSGKEVSDGDQWKLMPEDVAEAVAQVVLTPAHVLIHRLEVRTLTVPKKSHGK